MVYRGGEENMEWLGDLLSGLGTAGAAVGSGGLLGLVGAGLSAFSKGRQRKAEFSEKQAERDHELRLLELQHSRASREDLHTVELMETEGSFTGMEASINAEAQVTDVHRWVNDVRSLTRPVLTLLLICIVGWMFNDLLAAAVDASVSNIAVVLGKEAVVDLIKYIVYSVVFSATTAIVWWFGDRALTPPGYRGR